MSRYLEILAVQRPFHFDTDGAERNMFSCNFTARAAADVTDWERELGRLISDAGLGTENTDLFYGATKNLPAGDGPYVQVLDSGGQGPDETHSGAKTERLSVQIIVRAKSYTAARSRALAIWRELDGQRNVNVAA